jgi:hypothetical protein
MEKGQLVRVRQWPSGFRVLVVADIKENILHVCTPEEWHAAEQEGRAPLCVGVRAETAEVLEPARLA